MPHHWRPIRPGTSGTAARVQEVQSKVTSAGGSVLFVGPEENTSPERWYALVDVARVSDADAMWRSIGTKGSAKKLR